MRFYGDVIARKGKKYWIGRIKRGVFFPKEELNALITLDKLGLKYVTLEEYAKIVGLYLTIKELEAIRKKTGYAEVWVMDQAPPKVSKSGIVTDTQWDRWYFRFLHPVCQKCILDCKQSSRVDIMCPNYKAKE